MDEKNSGGKSSHVYPCEETVFEKILWLRKFSKTTFYSVNPRFFSSALIRLLPLLPTDR